MNGQESITPQSLIDTLDDVESKLHQKSERREKIDDMGVLLREITELRSELVRMLDDPEQNVSRLMQILHQTYGILIFAEIDRDPKAMYIDVPPHMQPIDVYEAILLFGGMHPSPVKGRRGFQLMLTDPEEINVLMIRLQERGIDSSFVTIKATS